MFFLKCLFLCESVFLEAIFFLMFGLPTLFFEICGACSQCEWPFLLMYLTLLIVVHKVQAQRSRFKIKY